MNTVHLPPAGSEYPGLRERSHHHNRDAPLYLHFRAGCGRGNPVAWSGIKVMFAASYGFAAA